MFSLQRIFLKITRSSLEKYKIKKEMIMERFWKKIAGERFKTLSAFA